MPDREKTIKGLEKLREDLGYGLPDRSNVVMEYLNSLTDAIDLLEEQEPIPCGEKIKAGDVVLDFYKCGYCKNAIRKPWKYCPFCGRQVKWE